VNPKYERVEGYTGIWDFSYNPQSVLDYQRIVIRDGSDIFTYLMELRKYIPVTVPILVVLDELHIYDNADLQTLATTSRSLNVNTVVVVQKLSKINTIWVTEADKLLIFKLNSEHLHILKGSIYQYAIPDNYIQMWHDYPHGFIVYDHDSYNFVKNL